MLLAFMIEIGDVLGKNWRWLDIGAHHPEYLSNTKYFYDNGVHGINVEANPILIKEFYKRRKKDINLNIAIGNKKNENRAFYIMHPPTLSTLSQTEMERYIAQGYKLKQTITIKTMTVADVIQRYNNGVFPELLSIDAEGYDLEILKSIAWDVMRPKIICAENGAGHCPEFKNGYPAMQNSELSKYLFSRKYDIIACTLGNTIFIDTALVARAA